MGMDEYVVQDGKKLRKGYTTGSCAAAAAKAAALMLLTGEEVCQVRLDTPSGVELDLEVEDISRGGTGDAGDTGGTALSALETAFVSCAVRKDSGDDPDVTNGRLIYARVEPSRETGVFIDGGRGVGRVTKPGLDQGVGNAAINSTPRRMIERCVLEARDMALKSGKSSPESLPAGFKVIISIPDGEELAAKTFNPKLGIVGGISVLGTTGIVEPMSEQALLDTIRVEINVRKAEGYPVLPMAPGNYGKEFFRAEYGFSLDTAAACSNFVKDAVEMAAAAGFEKLLFVGHIGKLVKVAGGIENTHSKYGDHRMEIMTRVAGGFLGGEDFDRLSGELSSSVSTDEAIRILKVYGIDSLVMSEITRRVKKQVEEWSGGALNAEVVLFSNVYGELGKTSQAPDYMRQIKEYRI